MTSKEGKTDAFCVKKSYCGHGHIRMNVSLKAYDRHGNTVRIQGGCDLSSAQARKLAQTIIEEADKSDAKLAAKEAADARREKWRQQEIAAGRLKIIKLR